MSKAHTRLNKQRRKALKVRAMQRLYGKQRMFEARLDSVLRDLAKLERVGDLR